MIRVITAGSAVPPAVYSLLQELDDIELIAEVPHLEALLILVEQLKPAVILLTDFLPPFDCVEVVGEVKRLKRPVAVLVVTGKKDGLRAERLLGAGIQGVVYKNDLEGGLVEAVRAVAVGGGYLSASLAVPAGG